MKGKGFGLKVATKIECQMYTAELKRRYLTDNSEMLLGTAKIFVPKTLHDRTGQTPTKREAWDAFARAVCYCLLCCKAGDEKGVNQIFLFDSAWNLMERLETNAWEEGDQEPSYMEPLSDKTTEVAWEAFKRCEVQIDWLAVPVVA